MGLMRVSPITITLSARSRKRQALGASKVILSRSPDSGRSACLREVGHQTVPIIGPGQFHFQSLALAVFVPRSFRDYEI